MSELKVTLEKWAERYNDDSGMYEGFQDAVKLLWPVIEAADSYSHGGLSGPTGKRLEAALESLRNRVEEA